MTDTVTIAGLRERVIQALQTTSLRALAKDIGVSPPGLAKFVRRGGTCYRPTRKRLLAWHARRSDALLPTPDPAAAAAAVEILVMELRADVRRDVRRELAHIIGSAYGGRVTIPLQE